MSGWYESVVDRQIREAQERGEFDNLPGAGKPLPRRALSGDAWLRSYLDREGVSSEATPTQTEAACCAT